VKSKTARAGEEEEEEEEVKAPKTLRIKKSRQAPAIF
jgi:hypothetical protein